LQHFGNDRAIIRLAAIRAARNPRLEGFLAQIAARGKLQEWADAGARQRDRIFALMPALFRRRGSRRPEKAGQPLSWAIRPIWRLG
jgi:hypothetical protein